MRIRGAVVDVTSLWKDRKHWEINIGPVRLQRWCDRDCALRNYEGKHPLHVRWRP